MKLKGKSLPQTIRSLVAQGNAAAPAPRRVLVVDAGRQVVGRVANQLAVILQGKDRPDYCPWENKSDVVAVVNAQDLHFTGKKWEQKTYRWHTGHPGSLKERTAEAEARRGHDRVLLRAVAGMLPKTTLRKAQLSRLFVFPGPEHPFTGCGVPVVARPLFDRSERVLRKVTPLPESYVPLNPQT